jgi:hypothetical protein
MDNRPKLLKQSALISLTLGLGIIVYSMIRAIHADESVIQGLFVIFILGQLVVLFSAVTLYTASRK